MTADSPLPNSGYTAQKSLSLFDTVGGATLNSATEFDDWTTRSAPNVLQFADYHWISGERFEHQ